MLSMEMARLKLENRLAAAHLKSLKKECTTAHRRYWWSKANKAQKDVMWILRVVQEVE